MLLNGVIWSPSDGPAVWREGDSLDMSCPEIGSLGADQLSEKRRQMATDHAPAKNKGELAVDFMTEYLDLCREKPGWLSYHFANVTPFGQYLLAALVKCEERVPGLGYRFIREFHAVKYVSAATEPAAWKARFEELIQKLAELLVARALCTVDWPADTLIEFEPVNKSNNKRPEFSVRTPERLWLFEVKCPSFIAHQENRSLNPHQIPIRGFMRDAPHIAGETVTLPRDNTLKDFLKSAQEKFAGFDAGGATGILVVVWDLYMYEAISVLMHPQAGLLTENSWFMVGDEPVKFPDVAGVIVLNRLEQLKQGAQERIDHIDPFRLGGPDALPNTWCPNIGVGDLDPTVASGFDAHHFEATAIGADYSITDYVMWIEPPSEMGRRIARARRRRQSRDALMCSVSPLALT